MTLKVLDLFSGIGGFSLGLERAGMETVAFCEIEAYPRKVLEKHWPAVPIHDDVRGLDGTRYRGTVELICGGYPCQPFSTAGKRRGQEDDRHLWPEVYRLLQEIGPRWFIGENVAGHVSMGLDQVLSDLESAGYTAQPFIIPAVALDAPHRRDRVWIVAHTQGERLERQRDSGACSGACSGVDQGCRSAGRGDAPIAVALANEIGRRTVQQQHGVLQEARQGCADAAGDSGPYWGRDARGNAWEAEPAVGRVADGIPARVDRLRCLGNSVVPQIPELIGRAIMAIETTGGWV